MKIKLKLTRNEYKGVATIAKNCCNALAGVTFVEVQYRDALRGLMLRMAAKIPTLKAKGNKLTLVDIEALALWETVNDLAGKFQPFEMSVGLSIIAEIDRQRNDYVSLMRANLMEQKNYYLEQ